MFQITASNSSLSKREHVASVVECYMKQHGAIEEEAITELYEQIKNAWKDVNEECLFL